MTKAWETFYPYIQPHVAGCPEIVIDQHLLEAATDFCERSEVWRYELETLQTYAGVGYYYLDMPTASAVENVLDFYVDGSLATRVTDLYLRDNPNMSNARPTHFSYHQDGQVRFYPTPDASYGFSGTCVLKPSSTASGVEDFIYESHRRTIVCGALATLMIIPGKEWSNPELSTYHAAKFYKATDDAKGRDVRRTNLHVRSVNFA